MQKLEYRLLNYHRPIQNQLRQFLYLSDHSDHSKISPNSFEALYHYVVGYFCQESSDFEWFDKTVRKICFHHMKFISYDHKIQSIL